jgi:hypothetical protein
MLMLVFGLGLAITMFLKYLNYSTNPFWCTVDSASGGWNKTGLALAALALVEYYYRPTDLFPAPPLPAGGVEKSSTQAPDKAKPYGRVAVIVGLGSFINL